MREVGTLEARNSLSALLELVEHGEEITITRHGRPVARLVPAQVRDVEKARQAARDLLDMRKEVRPDPEGLTIRDYIEMGRRY
ncbi:type II toxin-antitoxin system prevent-host-death family antitoxin [Mesorhizobium sp. CN2-181]|uniref:type II toxin-antitoxin system Phd/YefM family antitoxin n=1 Tax=Mesorhizobium yinganensis TaxID=3157707 RepID=UPI0032B87FA4